MSIKHRAFQKIEKSIIGPSDLLGNAKPSVIFYPMITLLSHLLSCDPDKMVSRTSIFIRKCIYPILKLLLPLFLEYKQVLESKNVLLGIDAPDVPVELSNETLIWCPNHRFKDDVAASIRVTRHAYILFGSFPMFFNTFDGIGAYINGVVMCNRKIKASKVASMEAAKRVLSMGMDMLIFPEGVWNKTPEKMLLDFWPGAYRLAIESGSKIVPVIHYLADPHKKYPGNVIHTVVADPISMEGLTEEEGLDLMRDTMATWYYLMMKKYGQSTRKELLGGHSTANDAWDSYIQMHIGGVKFYDKEIEQVADYRPKQIVRPENVFEPISNIHPKNISAHNIKIVLAAKEIVREAKENDYQRMY